MYVLCDLQHPSSVYGRIATASLAETVLSPAPCDSVQEASGHSPSEPLSSKSSPDEGVEQMSLSNVILAQLLWLNSEGSVRLRKKQGGMADDCSLISRKYYPWLCFYYFLF